MIDSIDNSMAAPFRDAEGSGFVSPETDAPVSYTHLTLPTSDLV